jgi:hypothetical protein
MHEHIDADGTKSAIAALAIHIMGISRLSSFWLGMAHPPCPWWVSDMMTKGAEGVNCDNYK